MWPQVKCKQKWCETTSGDTIPCHYCSGMWIILNLSKHFHGESCMGRILYRFSSGASVTHQSSDSLGSCQAEPSPPHMIDRTLVLESHRSFPPEIPLFSRFKQVAKVTIYIYYIYISYKLHQTTYTLHRCTHVSFHLFVTHKILQFQPCSTTELR